MTAYQIGLDELPVDRIVVPPRLRAVDQDWVDIYAGSIAEKGLQQPIQVRRVGDGWELIAGAHRLAAVRQCGHRLISASVWEATPDQARLLEIDENLYRRELSPFDRAKFLAERQAVWERLHPETKRGARNRKGLTDTMSVSGFAVTASAKTGLTERTIYRAIALWKALSPDARALIEGTALAEEGALLAQLAKLPPGEQVATVKARLGGERGARPAADPVLAQYEKLVRAWARSGEKARERFRRFLAEEVAE